MRIRLAATPLELTAARQLASEYATLPHVEGRWVGAVAEIASLPGPYRPPRGGLFLAWSGADAFGCVAYQALDARSVELKRLYVSPGARGKGIGARLVRAVAGRARRDGYLRIRLDTAPELESAMRLYLEMGFREIGRYRDDLYADARCFELDLTPFRRAGRSSGG